MATNEQWIAQGKLLAAYTLLCDNIFGALAYLFGGDPGPESVGILLGYLRPPDQALAALQLLDERSKNGGFSARTFHDLRDSLKKAMDLATNDFRFPGMAFDLALYTEKMPEDPTATDVGAGLWSCLNVTQEAANIEVFALEYLQAATSLILALCRLRMDDERSLAVEKPASSVDVGVS
jgi:hypothetical protein